MSYKIPNESLLNGSVIACLLFCHLIFSPILKAGKAKSYQLNSGMRRTMSLDAIIGPYLQGHWPKEPEGPSSLSRKDKSTQVSSRSGNMKMIMLASLKSEPLSQKHEWNAALYHSVLI